VKALVRGFFTECMPADLGLGRLNSYGEDVKVI